MVVGAVVVSVASSDVWRIGPDSGPRWAWGFCAVPEVVRRRYEELAAVAPVLSKKLDWFGFLTAMICRSSVKVPPADFRIS
jgi:hypothetical protein